MSQKSTDLDRAILLEREANRLRTEQKIEEAFNAFDEAGTLYRRAGEHFKAALCFSSAATCWNIRTGWQPLRNAATRNELAAREALKAKHYDYALSHFREAALLYEREGDFENYSHCFWWARTTSGRHAWAIFKASKNPDALSAPTESLGWKDRANALLRWMLNLFGRVTWGYGERPFRTLWLAAIIILGSAFLYGLSGQIAYHGQIRPVSFWEALYMSTITYTTVGFGDFLPLGWARIIAVHEALAGIFLTPLFLVGLSRRYLRMHQ